jgi:uncharacterized protein (DUF2141 family)
MNFHFIVSIFLLTTCFSLPVNSQEKITLTIHIEGIKKKEGSILVMLSNSEASFLTEGEGFKVSANDNKATVRYLVQKGEYAFSFFHDKNDNGKFDTNFLGIPKEPYGFSNNASGFMGPPSYDKAKFTIYKNTTMTVSF